MVNVSSSLLLSEISVADFDLSVSVEPGETTLAPLLPLELSADIAVDDVTRFVEHFFNIARAFSMFLIKKTTL